MSDIIAKVQDAIKKDSRILDLGGIEITNELLYVISKFLVNYETITHISMTNNRITSLGGIIFPPHVVYLRSSHNQITTLQGFVIPESLVILALVCIFFFLSITELTTHVQIVL